MNVSGYYAGIIETPLTKHGRQQAKKAGVEAKSLGINLILSSPLNRAFETAGIIARQIGYNPKKIRVSPLLVERAFGSLEGKPHVPDLQYTDIKEIEQDDELVQRAFLALEWINSFSADHILVVSHGSFGRALRSILKTEYPMSHPKKINNAELLCWIEEGAA